MQRTYARWLFFLAGVVSLASGSLSISSTALHKRQTAADAKRLGHLRATFGEPKVKRDSYGVPSEMIWVTDILNYYNTQLFRVGKADERLFINANGYGETTPYIAMESKSGKVIRKVWYAKLKEVKDRKSIPEKELRSMGTLEAYLARHGYSIQSFPNRKMELLARKVLKEKTPYAMYFTLPHSGDNAMYCIYVKVDGTEVPDELDENYNPIVCNGNNYPQIGIPYPITIDEQLDMQSRKDRSGG